MPLNSMPTQASAFYPTSAAQLHDHLQIPSILDHCIPGALTWYQFHHRHKSHLCPRWHLGQHPLLNTIVALWPQHSAITSYFTQIPDSTTHSLSQFTWLIHRFLDPCSHGASMGVSLGLDQGFPICRYPSLPTPVSTSLLHTWFWPGGGISIHILQYTIHVYPGPLGMGFPLPAQSG